MAIERIENKPKPGFYNLTLRHTGYDNYHALCEFSDNSIDNDVEADFCNFTFVESENKEQVIEKIIISDNGTGMLESVARQFLDLGSTTRTLITDLGGFGTGAKTATWALGRRLTFLTKVCDSDIIKCCCDLDDFGTYEDLTTTIITSSDVTQEERDMFFDYSKNMEHGTVMVIDKIDRISEKKITTFKKHFESVLSETYSMFLETHQNKHILIEGKEIKKISYVGGTDKNGNRFEGNLMNCIEDDFMGCNIKISCYYMPNIKGLIDSDSYDIPANQANCGIYFFRNGRLVGKGLKPQGAINNGVIGGDGHSSYFRVIVEYGGEMDEYLKGLSTFNKMVIKGKELPKDFKDFLFKHINPSYRIYRKAEDERISKNKNEKSAQLSSVLTKKAKNIIDDKKINLVNKQAINKKKENEDGNKNVESDNKNKNTSGIKNRDRTVANEKKSSRWLNKIAIVDTMSQYDDLYRLTQEDGKYNFYINQNNLFYERVLSYLNDDQLLDFVLYQLTQEIALFKADISDEDYRDTLLNAFEAIKREHNRFIFDLYKDEIKIKPIITSSKVEVVSNN